MSLRTLKFWSLERHWGISDSQTGQQRVVTFPVTLLHFTPRPCRLVLQGCGATPEFRQHSECADEKKEIFMCLAEL